MIKWIIGSVIAMTIILWCAGVRAQITTYLGPQGQYLGQSIVIAPIPSPTQPVPPAYWGPNGR